MSHAITAGQSIGGLLSRSAAAMHSRKRFRLLDKLLMAAVGCYFALPLLALLQ